MRHRGRPHAVPETAPSRDLRLLCCEGACSRSLHTYLEKEEGLRGVGYAPTNLRAAESAAMTHTPHYFVRLSPMGATNFHLWACTVCGNERIYGAEEL